MTEPPLRAGRMVLRFDWFCRPPLPTLERTATSLRTGRAAPETAVPVRSAPDYTAPDYTANEVPQPQVAVALGLRMVKAAAIRSST